MGAIKNMAWNMFFANDLKYVLDKIDLDEQLVSIDTKYNNLQIILADCEKRYQETLSFLDRIIKQEEEDKKELELEAFWNNKRPKTQIVLYPARPPIGSLSNLNVDPRIFFLNKDIVPIFTGEGNDEKAKNSLQYVITNITYTPDMTQFKDNEVWLFPFETLALKKGDCEDGAILLANVLLASGVPYWRVRLNAGDVQGGGHAWVTYLRESDNQWVILDWCYWPNESKDLNKLYKDAEKYYDIWFSFNKNYIYLNEEFERV